MGKLYHSFIERARSVMLCYAMLAKGMNGEKLYRVLDDCGFRMLAHTYSFNVMLSSV